MGTLEADSHLFHQQNKVNVSGFGWEGWGSLPISTSVAWQGFATLKENLRVKGLKPFSVLEKQEENKQENYYCCRTGQNCRQA